MRETAFQLPAKKVIGAVNTAFPMGALNIEPQFLNFVIRFDFHFAKIRIIRGALKRRRLRAATNNKKRDKYSQH
jgi:hypothetical protein